MKRYLLVLIYSFFLSMLSAQQTEVDYPTIVLNGTEDPRLLAEERIKAINEILKAENKTDLYGLKWDKKQLTKELVKDNCTHLITLEKDMQITFKVSEYDGVSYHSIYFKYSKEAKQVYNGYLRRYQSSFGESLDRLLSAQQFYAYVGDIKTLLFADQMKGLELAKVGAVEFYVKEKASSNASSVAIDRPALAKERLKAINDLYAYEFPEDRLAFSMAGEARVKFVDDYNCKTTLNKLASAQYEFKKEEDRPHQVRVKGYSKRSPACSLKDVNFNIHQFSSKELADLFIIYITDIKHILYDPQLDPAQLHAIKPIPAHLVKRTEQKTEPFDLSAYQSHPQLKYLGVTAKHPDLIALRNGKNGYMYFSDYKPLKGYYYNTEKDIISSIVFYTKKKPGGVINKKIKVYKKELPEGIKGVKMERLNERYFDRVVYTLTEEALQQLSKGVLEENLNADLAYRKKSGEDYLIQTKEDFKRYADPKGGDIWRLIGSYRDTLFSEYLYDQNTKRFGGFTKDWNEVDEFYLANRNYRLSTKYGYTYVIKRAAAVSGKEDFLKERLPIDIDYPKFDLGIFLPQIFALPEFVSARYGDDTEKVFGRSITYKVIDIKLNTPFGNRYIHIRQYSDEKGGAFSELRFRKDKHGGHRNTDLVPLTPENNPWKTHNEAVVNVDQTDEKNYVKAFADLLDHMEGGFRGLVGDMQPFQSENFREVYVMANNVIPDAEKTALILFQKKGNNCFQIEVTDKVKNEVYSTFIKKKDIGSYHLVPGGVENEELYGKCMIVKKARKTIGVIKFDQVSNEGRWWIRFFPFDQKQFESSLAKVLQQGAKDNYAAWEKEAGAKKSKVSAYCLYHASLSVYSEDGDSGFSFISFYQDLPQYILEHTLSVIKEKTELAPGIMVKENFYDIKTNRRYVKLNVSGEEFLVLFAPEKSADCTLHIGHGGDYDLIKKENFAPLTLFSVSSKVIEELKKEGTKVVWSSITGKSFGHTYPTSSKEGSYKLIVFYETKYGEPSCNVTFKYQGKIKTSSAQDADVIPILEKFAGKALAFSPTREFSEFRIHGGYFDHRSKGEVLAYLLKID